MADVRKAELGKTFPAATGKAGQKDDPAPVSRYDSLPNDRLAHALVNAAKALQNESDGGKTGENAYGVLGDLVDVLVRRTKDTEEAVKSNRSITHWVFQDPHLTPVIDALQPVIDIADPYQTAYAIERLTLPPIVSPAPAAPTKKEEKQVETAYNPLRRK